MPGSFSVLAWLRSQIQLLGGGGSYSLGVGFGHGSLLVNEHIVQFCSHRRGANTEACGNISTQTPHIFIPCRCVSDLEPSRVEFPCVPYRGVDNRLGALAEGRSARLLDGQSCSLLA